MSLNVAADMLTPSGFPRVSGDEPVSMTGLRPPARFSPRERG